LLCSMGRNLQLSSRAQEEEDSKRKTEYFFFLGSVPRLWI
jgi:hypothetical protein